jgi:hypothetical protein
LVRANVSLLAQPLCGNAVRRDAKMLNSSIERSIAKDVLAIPERSYAGYKHKDCFLADMNCARFKRTGESWQRQRSLAQEQEQKGNRCLFRLPKRRVPSSNWQSHWFPLVSFPLSS